MNLTEALRILKENNINVSNDQIQQILFNIKKFLNNRGFDDKIIENFISKISDLTDTNNPLYTIDGIDDISDIETITQNAYYAKQLIALVQNL